ncbi:hypothetical protein B296_00002269 [Ensete ventricosum]|uniref:Uncharacterized protein n=1 Tax=Ensete ventricosum TaxID=4639 RepID=A0A427ASC3_ENSVE|nr:hypothetical protein B296_00002269 [Ensete ventricosum]
MDDPVLRVSERRSLMVQARDCTFSSPAESLLSRLEQFDHRVRATNWFTTARFAGAYSIVHDTVLCVQLRQLEEKQRLLPDCYFTADLQLRTPRAGQHHRSNSLSAMHEVHLKSTLMDRLHLLETRIRQLSFQLDKEIGTGTSRGADANGSCIHTTAVTEEKNKDTGICSSTVVERSWRTGELFKSGARELQSQKPRTTKVIKLDAYDLKVKELKKAAGAAEKTATSAMRQNERRRQERSRLYRRWFSVGC